MNGSFKLANTSKCPYCNSINIFLNDRAQITSVADKEITLVRITIQKTVTPI
jgi:hypothetical protein